MRVAYTILYRPQGSKCWTPWHGPNDEEPMRWLWKLESAKDVCAELLAVGYEREIINPNLVVPLEFAVAEVSLVDNTQETQHAG